VYHHVLVPVDGSETSRRALEEAIHLALDQHATLRIVHVFEPHLLYADPYAGGVDLAAIYAAERQGAQQILDDAVAIARQHGLSAESVLLEPGDEPLSDRILEEVRAWPADLLVMGTHGRHGLAHLILGSMAEGCVHHATVPVLLVRAP
jgi:nucleotide-binding universal stress UspA family protein